MYNQPFFIPNFYSTMAAPNIARGIASAPILNSAATGLRAGRGLGLFGRLGSSLSALRGINWGGLINNASKTLGVINQTIPLVKQVGPMVNNMKSMLKIASVFKDETDKPSIRRKNNYPQTITNQKPKTNETTAEYPTKQPITQNYSPTFFINN